MCGQTRSAAETGAVRFYTIYPPPVCVLPDAETRKSYVPTYCIGNNLMPTHTRLTYAHISHTDMRIKYTHTHIFIHIIPTCPCNARVFRFVSASACAIRRAVPYRYYYYTCPTIPRVYRAITWCRRVEGGGGLQNFRDAWRRRSICAHRERDALPFVPRVCVANPAVGRIRFEHILYVCVCVRVCSTRFSCFNHMSLAISQRSSPRGGVYRRYRGFLFIPPRKMRNGREAVIIRSSLYYRYYYADDF